jgi:putative methionine-R-sulfoxide reductase with GAF domain
MARPYREIEEALTVSGGRVERMRTVVDLLWDRLHTTGVSWVGFYVHEGGDVLVLGPRRDKPACSPIGLHGVCGQAFRTRRPQIVADVRALGADYIACDPRDLAEVVLPLLEDDGRCWGVLDVDSHAVGAFDETDVVGLNRIMRAAGLTAPNPAADSE